MAFNPNTDTNWANVVNTINGINGAQAQYFYQTMVQWFCGRATSPGSDTLNAAEVTSAINAALFTVQHENVRNF